MTPLWHTFTKSWHETLRGFIPEVLFPIQETSAHCLLVSLLVTKLWRFLFNLVSFDAYQGEWEQVYLTNKSWNNSFRMPCARSGLKTLEYEWLGQWVQNDVALVFNTFVRPKQNDPHFAEFLLFILINETSFILHQISLTCTQTKAWHRSGDKPLTLSD